MKWYYYALLPVAVPVVALVFGTMLILSSILNGWEAGKQTIWPDSLG
jgi:hypothetical protein